jgi:hypothetical protein
MIIDNNILYIVDQVLVDKYTVVLKYDATGLGTCFLSIQKDLGAGVVEVASVSYNDMMISGIDPAKTVISAPKFYAELTANNCVDFGYTFITSAFL